MAVLGILGCILCIFKIFSWINKEVEKCTEHMTNIVLVDAEDMITDMIITTMTTTVDADMTTDMTMTVDVDMITDTIITITDVVADVADTNSQMKMLRF